MLYHLDRGWADHLAYLVRYPGEHPPAGAGSAKPARRIPPARRRRVHPPGRRRHRGLPADLRDGQRARRRAGPGPVQTGPAHLDVDLHGPRQPAAGRHSVRAEPARSVPLGVSPADNFYRMQGRVLTIPNVLSVIRLVLRAGVRLPAAGSARLRAGRGHPDVQRRLGLGRRQDRPPGAPTSPPGWGSCSTLWSTGSTWWRSRWVWRWPAWCRGGVVAILLGRDAPARRDAAGGARPGSDRASGHLHRQGRHLRADVRIPADSVGTVGLRLEQGDRVRSAGPS